MKYVWVQITPDLIAEGDYEVVDAADAPHGLLRVVPRLGGGKIEHKLAEGEDPHRIAQRRLRARGLEGHNPFYDPIDYGPPKGIV
jgi:hypothetical protein